jgi:hypothetical protein
MDINLRLAVPADAVELARIHVAAWQEAYRGIVPESTLEQFTIEGRTEHFRSFLTEGTAETYLAEYNNRAMGFSPDGATKQLPFGIPVTAIRYRKHLS